MTRIYLNQILHVNSILTLEDQPFNHVIRVLRMKCEQTLIFFNGDNYEYHAVIQEITKKSFTVSIQHAILQSRESSLSLHLYQSIPKSEKMDWILQKSTELGIHSITPVISAHTANHFSTTQLSKKMQHWQNVIISACEQSGRNQLPILNPPQYFNQLTFTTALHWLSFTPTATRSLRTHFNHFNNATLPPIGLIIGPEGGFSPAECDILDQCSHMVHLGTRILRTETVSVAILGALQAQYGDWI